ncbi:MAG: 3'-5' exonuclease [Candidatus Delongbacteria bacterium]|nr:3'-5' exonuclease [Candidatus Delongbacteria bacterium]
MRDNNTFTAIDFETATSKRNSICSVGIVTVENGVIVEEYSALIRPPYNEYNWHNTNVHGIYEEDTEDAPSFDKIYHEIKKRLYNRVVVAHNESFDRNVLKYTMEHYGLDYSELGIADRWECTMKIYRALGCKPARLNSLCYRYGIHLDHHDALSDARGCAKLFLRL